MSDFINTLFAWATENIAYLAPTLLFFFFLAGVCVPGISEDVLVILAAGIVSKHVATTGSYAYLVPIHIVLWFGAWTSDWIVFFLGRLIKKGASRMKKLQNSLTPENLYWISSGIEKYKLGGFICERFIPFGVRNLVSLSCGFVGLKFKTFMIYDGIAAIINTACLYYLVFLVGEKGQTYIWIIGVALLLVIIALATVALIRHKKACKLAQQKKTEESQILSVSENAE